MIFVQYILQILGVFAASFLLYLAYLKLNGLRLAWIDNRMAMSELRTLVQYTTPQKDEELKKQYHGNRKAIKIIENTDKLNNTSLKPVPQYATEPQSVFKMSRREQVAQQLAYKRAQRAGTQPNKEGKILQIYPDNLDEEKTAQ